VGRRRGAIFFTNACAYKIRRDRVQSALPSVFGDRAAGSACVRVGNAAPGARAPPPDAKKRSA